MRCMVCGEEMRLVRTVSDETKLVLGFEHHTFNCPSCHDEERRLVFTRQAAPFSPLVQAGPTESAFLDAAPQPVAGKAATYSPLPVESSGRLKKTPAIAPPVAPALYQAAASAGMRGAIGKAWERKATLYRVRWKALCDRLGMRFDRGTADGFNEK